LQYRRGENENLSQSELNLFSLVFVIERCTQAGGPCSFGICDSEPERYPLTFVTVINVDLNVAASTFHGTASRFMVIGKLGMPKRWQLANNAPGLARRGDPARRRSARNSHCLAFAVAGYRLFGARRENRLISGAHPMGKLA